MKKFMIIILISCSICLFSKENFQIDFNIGLSNTGPSIGGIYHHFITKDHLISSRFISCENFIPAAVEPIGTEKINEISLMYTYQYKNRLLLSSGIGYSWGRTTTNYSNDEIDFKTFSVPLNLNFNIVSFYKFKIGLNCFSILNTKILTGGAAYLYH